MSPRIVSLAALALSAVLACAASAQSTTPGGGPEPTLKDYVHPPSLSAPDVGQRASASAPRKRASAARSKSRAAPATKPHSRAKIPTKGKASTRSNGPSSAPR
jgi:hypothetical protein